MEKTKEQIASEWAGLKLELFTDTKDLKHIHPYITPKQCLRAMEAYAEQQVNLLNKPSVVNCKITDKIYQTPIHTSMEVNTGASTFDIVRVAGGWIYSIYRLDSNQMTSTFVPFDNEFMCDK